MSEPAFLTFWPILERALLYVAVAITALVAFTRWRRGDTCVFREPLIAFVALWFVEGALLAATAEPALAPAALVRGLDFASILLLAWAFLAASLPARANSVILGTGLMLTATLDIIGHSVLSTTPAHGTRGQASRERARKRPSSSSCGFVDRLVSNKVY